ncbi:PITH domain-containing protein 1 [Quillaja saponaria]|uniref:PITH domain-containing protein 1 n=1 Tax=Quillaja saponaria TaxID=32244 RepID=A0AAD7PKL8_QUISA|nr:PITH domain-containing protein 1 [Quillaja saponaria]
MACLHDHSREEHYCSSDWSLYKHLSRVSALNEATPGSVKSVLKLGSNLHQTSRSRGISIVGGADGTSPSKMRVIVYRDGIDFSVAQSMQAIQELVENIARSAGIARQARYSKFQSGANITLHFPENFGCDTTQIHYIGFKGEATQDPS